MTTTLLISEAKVRAFSDLNESVDNSLITNGIREAQDIVIQPIIGTKLYNTLITKIDNNSVSSSYATLIDDYIQPALVYASIYNATEAVYVRTRNNGLLTPTGGENSVNVDKTIYDSKRQSIFNKQQFYSDQLSRYLSENFNQFPELGQNTLLYQFVPDYGSQYRSPIVMQRNTRAIYLNLARQAGLPIVNSAYPSYPPPGPNKI
jgi:hypothetical protein|tara:strand:+ start:1839 stop:2453 length:615 start_codon:yes stop_codon:yes gene_type:complete